MIMKLKTITCGIGAAGLFVVGLALLLICTPARAGDDYYRTHSRATDRAHCAQFGIDAACSYRPRRHIRRLQREAREERWHRHHGYRKPQVRSWRHYKGEGSKGDDGGFCSDEVSAVGTEHYSEEDAKKAAVKAWMAEVRHRRGTEFMDISVAEDVKFRCVTSTPGDRISDKVAAWTRGDLLKECRVMATPCKPPIEEGLPKGLVRDR
jgi:hypothetical protein